MRKSITNGVIWSGIERFLAQGIQFVFSFVIARMLSPEDYGLVAMFSIFMVISQCLVDSGLNDALIQKKNRSETDISTVFYFNIIVAIIVYTILCGLAGPISSFYNQPLLKKIIYYSSLTVIFRALSSVQIALISIKLDYKRLASISAVVAIVSGLLSLYMAYKGFGVWTLVISSLLASALRSILLWLSSSWRPQLLFSWNSFKALFGFGYKLMVGGLIHHLYTNLYSLIIGKIYTKEVLGYFNRASSMTQYPSTNIAGTLLRVFYPVECELQDDNQKLTQAYFRFIRHAMFIVSPLMFGLIALAEPFVRTVLTDKWIGCVPYIQILSIAYLWEPVMMISWSILNAKHRSDLSLKSEIIKKITAFTIMFISIPFGVKAMALGLIIYSIADILIISIFLQMILKEINIISIMRNLFPFLLVSSLMAATVMGVNSLLSSYTIQLVCGILLGPCAFFLLSNIFKLKELDTILSKAFKNDRNSSLY